MAPRSRGFPGNPGAELRSGRRRRRDEQYPDVHPTCPFLWENADRSAHTAFGQVTLTEITGHRESVCQAPPSMPA